MLERIVNWLIALANRAWVTVLLLSATVSSMAYSLDRANWVTEDRQLISIFLIGLAFGWLLANSRFTGLASVFYAIFISVVMPVELVAKIVPSPGAVLSTPFLQLLNQLNLRGFEFVLRVNGWLGQIKAGEIIRDTGLFILFMGVLLSLCGVWMMWKLWRQNHAFEALLPAAFMMAVNIHLSRQSLTQFWVFIFCLVLLIAQHTFIRQHKDWQNRQVDYPEQLGLGWGGAAVTLAVVIAMFARLAPLVGTPQGWQSIADWVEKNRARTSETAERLFSGVNPPPPAEDGQTILYANTPNLQEIGRAISQGSETVFWVRTSDPAPLPPQVAANISGEQETVHYWRGFIFHTYTGRGWNQPAMEGEFFVQETLPETPPPGRYYLRQDFELVARTDGSVFAVNEPVQTDGNAYIRSAVEDGSQIVQGTENEYQVISTATRVTANQLIEAPVTYPEVIARLYLQLPVTLPDRVRRLAQRVASGADNPYTKALRIQEYLRTNFQYDLATQPAPGNRDVVDYFLFDSQRGFCSHYASAMVVMMRSLGVPARIVTGYAMGAYDYDRGAYRVPVSASHAWVEVYFPGYGWVEFEPTANRSPFVYPEVVSSDPGVSQLIPRQEETQLGVKPVSVILIITGAALLLALPFVLLRLFSVSRHRPEERAGELYRSMRRSLAWAGLRAGSHVTPDEFITLYGEKLSSYRMLDDVLRQATDLYCETMYGPRLPEEIRVHTISAKWLNAQREWFLLYLHDHWRKVLRMLS